MNFGRGIEKDSQKALEYYLKAANMGYMNAQFCLGYFYEMHSEYPESEKNSFYWYLKVESSRRWTINVGCGLLLWSRNWNC